MRDWNKVLITLQVRGIPETEMPRLFFECLLDRKKWEERTLNLQKEIMANNVRLQQIIDEMRSER